MLRKFEVRNYKNFRENFVLDFQDIAGYQFSSDCIYQDMISKMLIYGRNATGKSNLGKAIMNITATLVGDKKFNEKGVFLNADSKDEYALFTYTFQFDSDELIYKYTKVEDDALRSEQLTINGVVIFDFNFKDSSYYYENLDQIGAETVKIERYLQAYENHDNNRTFEAKLPFLRWLLNNAAFPSNSVLNRLSEYVKKMTMVVIPHFSDMDTTGFYKSLESPSALLQFENFLNAMGIECKLVLMQLPDGTKELYFNHEKLFSFYENASSGTLALANLYYRVISRAQTSSFLYLDEFDAFYHYEMAEDLIRFLKKNYPKCQIILTSHNTNLMTSRLMRPDCLFILSRTGKLTALCKATLRELREGHNFEKMYISGEFEAYE